MPIVTAPGSSGTTGGMTFLRLAQRLRQECRVSGSGPVAVTGQVAEYQRLLDWTAEAWRDIQRMNPAWRFMRGTASCATVSGKALYAPVEDFRISNFGRWAIDYANGDTFRCYDTTAGVTSENFLSPIEYDAWRDTWQFGANRNTCARPLSVAVAPNDSLATGPVAASGYTLIGDYYCKPVLLADGDQMPAMPEEYHMAIVYKAMTYYGVSEAAPEIFDFGQMQFNRIYAQMLRAQAPRVRMAVALA